MKKVGIPVSWQTGETLSTAISMLTEMVDMARPAWEAGSSRSIAAASAQRTSLGRLADVSVISARIDSLKFSIRCRRLKLSETLAVDRVIPQ